MFHFELKRKSFRFSSFFVAQNMKNLKFIHYICACAIN
nr:MAG TPA: hypothetical protein [Caudoviricetes sp.]